MPAGKFWRHAHAAGRCTRSGRARTHPERPGFTGPISPHESFTLGRPSPRPAMLMILLHMGELPTAMILTPILHGAHARTLTLWWQPALLHKQSPSTHLPSFRTRRNCRDPLEPAPADWFHIADIGRTSPTFCSFARHAITTDHKATDSLDWYASDAAAAWECSRCEREAVWAARHGGAGPGGAGHCKQSSQHYRSQRGRAHAHKERALGGRGARAIWSLNSMRKGRARLMPRHH